MQIHLAKDGAPLGVFKESDVRAKFEHGELAATDLAWHEGLVEWQPLSVILRNLSGGAPSVPATLPQPLFERRASTPAPVQPANSGLAIASLVCGILAFPSWFASVPAIITGHMALSEIKKAAGTVSGRGMALIGTILGYFFLIFWPVVFIVLALAIPTVMAIADQAQIQKTQAVLTTLTTATLQYHVEYNRFPIASSGADDAPAFRTDADSPFIDALLGQGPLNPRQLKVLAFPIATGGKDGLIESQNGATQFADPWGTPYVVLLDTNGDGVLANPDAENKDTHIASKAPPTLKTNIAIYSCGPDKAPKTHDDVVSWRKR